MIGFSQFVVAFVTLSVGFAGIALAALNFDCSAERFAFGDCLVKAKYDTQAACQSCTYESLDFYELPDDCDDFQEQTCNILLVNCSMVCAWESECIVQYQNWSTCAANHNGCPLLCQLPTADDSEENSGEDTGTTASAAISMFHILSALPAVATFLWLSLGL